MNRAAALLNRPVGAHWTGRREVAGSVATPGALRYGGFVGPAGSADALLPVSLGIMIGLSIPFNASAIEAVARMLGRADLLGHTVDWVDETRTVMTMIVEAIKWVLKLVDADVMPRAAR